MNHLKTLKMLAVAASVASLSGCFTQQASTTPAAATMPELPDWVSMPVVENGIADTQCVLAKPGIGMNYLKSTGTALARAELAKQIGIKVQAMDKTYSRLADTTEGQSVGSSFESVSKQVTDKHLSGSRAIKMGYVTMPPENTQNFCVMVAMSPEVTKALFQDLVTESGNNLSPKNEAVLYERFLAEKAQQELEAEFQKSQ